MKSLPPVHIRGLGLSCALGIGLHDCVTALASGSIRTVPVTLSGFNEPVEMPYYRIPDSAGLFEEARFERLILQVVHEAIRNAGLSPDECAGLPIFIGSSAFTVGLSESRYGAELAAGSKDPLPLPLAGFEHIAALIQKSLAVQGPAYAFNTACTAAANALLCATRQLQLGRAKHALVVGVELANQTTLAGFSGLQLIAKSLKPFDLGRSGIVLGEGIGAALLSTSAGSHGVRLIAGASNCDTHSVTTANPDGSSIASLQANLLAQAGLDASEIVAIKAHGTASPMNDTGEAAGMHRIFNPLPPVLALKPFTGHTLGACGVNELALLCGALKQGFLPATAGFEHEDPLLKVQPLTKRLPAPIGHYLLNYFGFGGNNAALLIEKHA